MIVPANQNGISNYLCTGGKFVLRHDGDKVLDRDTCGQHTTPDILEVFDTELDMETRIVQLGLIDDDE